MGRLSDLVALTKPRVTALVLATTAGGYWLAPGAADAAALAAVLVGTLLLVSAANALNQWLERDVDGLMERTRDRPLPAGRLAPRAAFVFGVTLALVSVPLLTFGVNALTGLLGVIALVSYVLVYTPMKRRSSAALLVGAVPGAIPPLLGWTAARGALDPPGLVLFATLFLWQVPHFIAISIFRGDEYARAGLRTVALDLGPVAARRGALLFAALLVPVSLLLVPLHAAGNVYGLAAVVLGVTFVAWTAAGLRAGDGRWARTLFSVSMIYLTLLYVALVVDAGA